MRRNRNYRGSSRKNCSGNFFVPEYFWNEILPHWQTRASQTKSAQKFGKIQKVVRIVQEIFLFRNTFGTRHYPIGKPERLKEKSAESYL